MSHSRRLFDHKDGFEDVPKGLHLVAGLSGFTDAGSTISQVSDQIFANLKTQLVVEFKNDELLDYRSRRPVMFFERDHIEQYEAPTLGIYLVHDETATPFLYLHGYEPDFRWQGFSEAVLEITESLEIADFTWVHSIPFPIPHTRSVGVTVSGNRLDVIDSVSEWKPQTQVPGNILHLLEYTFSQVGLPTIGYVILVPHYLIESEYPQSAIKAIEQIAATTGLVIPTDALRDEGDTFFKKLQEQIEKSEELAKMVANLEQGYAGEKNGTSRSLITKPQSQMPTSEEIAAELESYLATRRKNSLDD